MRRAWQTVLGIVLLAAFLAEWASPSLDAQSARPGPPLTPEVPQSALQEQWQALYGKAGSLYRQGNYAEALPAAKEALRVAESSFGPEHPNVAKSLFALAAVYHAQGKLAEAELLYKRSLAIAEKSLGPNHSDVGQTLSFLAGLRGAQKRYAEAEPLYRRSLAIAEKALRSDDPSLASLLTNYAGVLRKTGKVADAEQMEARANAIRAKHIQGTGQANATGQTSESRGDRDASAEVAYRKSDYARVLQLLRELASQESAFVARYRKAAVQGSATAQGLLGVIYEEGIGVSRDPVEAVGWFRKAADQGDPTAQKYLGDMYRRGAGVPTDYREAVKWYRRASEEGDGTAQAMLGMVYQKGLGVLPDVIQAYMWFTLAISHFEGAERAKMIEVRDRLSAGMPRAAIEKAEQLTREWKPASAPGGGGSQPTSAAEADPGDLAWRAVDLDDSLWVLDFMFVRGHPGTLQLGEEEVTQANGKDVLERLQRERQALADEMDRVGFSNISGDYELRPATGDQCKVSKAQFPDVLKPVSVVQNRHTVEFTGKGLVGCGVVVGTVVVMKPRECGGTTPFRLVGKVTDPGIEMTIWEKTSGTHCFLGTLIRRPAQR